MPVLQFWLAVTVRALSIRFSLDQKLAVADGSQYNKDEHARAARAYIRRSLLLSPNATLGYAAR